MADTLEALGIWPIKEYIYICQSAIVDQVDFRPTLCTGIERILGYSQMIRCQDQDVGPEEE